MRRRRAARVGRRGMEEGGSDRCLALRFATLREFTVMASAAHRSVGRVDRIRSNRIESSRIESNRIESSRIESNRIESDRVDQSPWTASNTEHGARSTEHGTPNARNARNTETDLSKQRHVLCAQPLVLRARLSSRCRGRSESWHVTPLIRNHRRAAARSEARAAASAAASRALSSAWRRATASRATTPDPSDGEARGGGGREEGGERRR